MIERLKHPVRQAQKISPCAAI